MLWRSWIPSNSTYTTTRCLFLPLAEIFAHWRKAQRYWTSPINSTPNWASIVSVQKPEPEWLNIVVTAKAKDSLKKYFRKQDNSSEQGQHSDTTTAKVVNLYIKGSDTMGVMMRILQVMSDEYRINFSDLHVTSDGNHFTCEVEAKLFDMEKLGKMCMKLRKIGGINTVNVTKIDGVEMQCDCASIAK